MTDSVIVRDLGVRLYEPVWQAMQSFTDKRENSVLDEIWRLQHLPVFTQGQAGKPEHILDPGEIPVVAVDRGGQVTYHAPGQLVIYLLLDIRRLGIGVRQLVTHIEQSVVRLLADYGIAAAARPDAPGVYVDGAKVAALGLRVRHGRCYHGLSLNVDLDLEPFERINPCGYRGLCVTQLSDLGVNASFDEITEQLTEHLLAELGYNAPLFENSIPAAYV